MWRAVMCLGLVACGRISFDETLDADAPLTLELATTQATINSSIAMRVTGGAPPYSISSDAGTIDVTAGLVWTPAVPSTFEVRVVDTVGDMVTASVSCVGDFLYVAGGYAGTTATGAVWRTADGTSWVQVGALPAPRAGGSLVVYDHRLYYLGGYSDNPNGTETEDVWSSDDGVSWTRVGSLAMPIAEQAVSVFGGRIWLGGGSLSSDAFVPAMWSSTDGAAWRQESPMPIAVHGTVLASHDGQLWLVAGHELTGQSAALFSTSDGTTWVTRGSVPAAGEYHGVISHQGRLWVGGGVGLDDRVVSTVDGASWVDTTRFPSLRRHTHLLSFAGELWAVAGTDPVTLHSPDGTNWMTAGPFPGPEQLTRASVFTPR